MALRMVPVALLRQPFLYRRIARARLWRLLAAPILPESASVETLSMAVEVEGHGMSDSCSLGEPFYYREPRFPGRFPQPSNCGLGDGKFELSFKKPAPLWLSTI